jgi:hypothetical protein
MGSFAYGTPRNRQWRKGVWLRCCGHNPALEKQILKKARWGEYISYIKIVEVKPDGFVIVEAWCKRPVIDSGKNFTWNRHTVIHLYIKEDPNWVCDLNLGRGMPKAEWKLYEEEEAREQRSQSRSNKDAPSKR